MAEQVNENGAGKVDLEHHARDYGRVIGMLKWGAVIAFVIAFIVLLIIS